MLLVDLIAFGLIGIGTLLKGVSMVSKLSGKTKQYKKDKKLLEDKKKEKK